MDREDMEDLLSTTASRVRTAWRRMVAHMREENSVDVISDRLAIGMRADLITGVAVSAAAFAAGQHAAYVHAGQAAARRLREAHAVTVAKKLLVFDAADPPAVAWAQRNRLDKIREITQEQRDAIHGILVQGARSGANPRVMAREIHETIGLTAKQEQIVANYRRQLEQGQLTEALARELTGGNADRTLEAALRSRDAIPPTRIDSMVDAYRSNWTRMRAETIGRTEGLRVAHQASDELYRQAVERGDLKPEQIVRTWVHRSGVRGKKDRSFHVSMNGQTRGYEEPFVSGLGNELMFPGDPDAPIEETAQCTCVVTVRVCRALDPIAA